MIHKWLNKCCTITGAEQFTMQTACQTDLLTLVMALLAACVTFTHHVVDRLMKATKCWWKTTWANTVKVKTTPSSPTLSLENVAGAEWLVIAVSHFLTQCLNRWCRHGASAFGLQPWTNTCRHHLRYFAKGFQLLRQKHWILSCKHTEGKMVNEGRTETRRERKRQRASVGHQLKTASIAKRRHDSPDFTFTPVKKGPFIKHIKSPFNRAFAKEAST